MIDFLAVFALSLKSLALGAPLDPALRIFSPDPPAIRLRFLFMFSYSPGIALSFCFVSFADCLAFADSVSLAAGTPCSER